MWAARVFLCKYAAPFPVAKISQSRPQVYNTLNCIVKHFSSINTTTQNIKLFNKPLLRLNVSSRGTVSVAAPKVNIPRKQVGTWLLLCSGMVYSTITLGGYTRLTESGLSMVTWRFTYETFPLSEADWMIEFEKYKNYPEYKQLKKNITLEEFKGIWWTEYLHRNLGRFIGIAFLIPAASFWWKGYFLPAMKKRVLLFGTLIACQGLLGWYMVKSGLEDRFHKETDIPRVSQYRLAAHLGMALTLYTGLLWTALDLLLPPQTIPNVTSGMRKLRILAHSSKGMIFLTALSGAFVAGLDAGLVYNSFPKMGDKWIPDDILAISPKIKNFTENPTTVQFDHRILGISTFSLITTMWFLSKRHVLPPRARILTNVLMLAACGQVILGISTLVHYVPVSQAIAHQSGSVLLLTIAIWLSHELKKLKYVPK